MGVSVCVCVGACACARDRDRDKDKDIYCIWLREQEPMQVESGGGKSKDSLSLVRKL